MWCGVWCGVWWSGVWRVECGVWSVLWGVWCVRWGCAARDCVMCAVLVGRELSVNGSNNHNDPRACARAGSIVNSFYFTARLLSVYQNSVKEGTVQYRWCVSSNNMQRLVLAPYFYVFLWLLSFVFLLQLLAAGYVTFDGSTYNSPYSQFGSWYPYGDSVGSYV